ncbi:MAG TPA: S9 family peptidase [Hyphomonadaceae bacterium]
MPKPVYLAAALALFAAPAFADPPRAPAKHFTAADVFNLEYANSPEISPDGEWVAYVRVSGDVMTDRWRRSIWIVDRNGNSHRPIAQGKGGYSQPTWAPDGRALAFVANEDGATELRVYRFDMQRAMTLTRLPDGASNLSWSPDGKTLAFQMFVEEDAPKSAALPSKPEGAEWNKPVRITDQVNYRADGAGLLKPGYTQIFVVPADGGTPRRITWAGRNHDGRMSWTPDGKGLLFSANAEDGWEYDPQGSDIYLLNVETAAIRRITTRKGPENSPAMSPDGKSIAYTGFDDDGSSYQVSELYVANADGAGAKSLTAGLDRDISDPQWAGNGAIWFMYEDKGATKLARIAPGGGKITTVLGNLGGTLADRPYTGGAYSVAKSGRFAAVTSNSQKPGDITVGGNGKEATLTSLNADLFSGKTIPGATLITTPSSYDRRPVEAWVVRPPDFDPARKYPLLLEIHGGPHTAYGPVFAAEVQLFAAAGYIVVYANPRGSTSYGEEFGALISHNYPSQDYDDLISVVDAVIAKEPVDPDRLYVTGGSGGGVLTAWIVGSTNRFKAAMVQKPVINWTSHVLSADNPTFFARYWFGPMPWEEGAQAKYWAHSPLSKVGNVSTPTAVLVGEEDNRTPKGEAEQYYQALKIRKVPTRLVLVPGSSHDIAGRPTGLIAKVNETISWFAQFGGPPVPDPNTGTSRSGETTPVAAAR